MKIVFYSLDSWISYKKELIQVHGYENRSFQFFICRGQTSDYLNTQKIKDFLIVIFINKNNMEKRGWIILVLGIILVALLGVIYYDYSREKQLKEKISGLETEREMLIGDNNNLLEKVKGLEDKMYLLEQDVNNIYKSCINNNACKGRFPGVRWYCNNVGDETILATASHLCQCDSSCQLNITQVNNI